MPVVRVAAGEGRVVGVAIVVARFVVARAIVVRHARADHVGQAPAGGGLEADLVEADTEHVDARGRFVAVQLGRPPTNAVPFLIEIADHEQLADLAHQRADDRFLARAQLDVFGQLARDAA
ncbi:hypothetical protein FEP92_04682 [Burkholderia multivorans]|nr:hypothetical protein [Burkholderia multivorans]